MNIDCHRHFVQHMLKKGIVPKRKVLPLLAKFNADGVADEASLETFLWRTNRKIAKHSFKVACVVCEVTGEELLVWLNTKNDNIARRQDTFTPAELEYFQVIMGEILSSNEKYLPRNICLNLSGSLVANVMFKTAAQATINKWVRAGYLVDVNGKVYFGPRCIQEFSSYFRRQENGVNLCGLCSEIVFVGSTCGVCSNVFHRVCLNTFLRRKKNCPNCKNQWEEADDES